jgi:hypothetical protein
MNGLDPRGGGAWGDDRLDAAFRTAYDRPAPGHLRDRIVGDLAGRAASPSSPRGFRQLFRTATAAAALVVTVLVAASLTSQGQPARPIGSALDSSLVATPRSVPLQVGVPFPAIVRPARGTSAYEVLSVADAKAIRDGGVDDREIAVAGWYSAPQPLPCPLMPDEYQPLENCSLNTSWLVTGPAPTGTFGPAARPSIQPVVDWSGSTIGTEPAAVVFVGHFDDAKAAQCPAGERRQRCEDRFVVDQVAWDQAQSLPDFPTEVAGLPIITVSEALAVRATNGAQELAVAGWYQWSGPMFCAMYRPVPLSFMEGDCAISNQWMMETPEPLYRVVPAGIDSAGIPSDTPVGPAFNAVFPTVGPPGVPRLDTFPGPPLRVLLVGHFNDARASSCRNETPQTCLLRFVVDAVAWSGDAARVLPEWRDLRYATGPSPAGDPIARVRALEPTGTILNVAAVDGGGLDRIEPGLDLPTDASYWIVTTIDTRGIDPVAGTFIVTTDGTVTSISSKSLNALDTPPPAPTPS